MYDHRRKLEWASEHLDALENSIRAFVDTQPYHLLLQFNLETRTNEARIDYLKRLNPDWSLMVGDVVHCLRSALDNLTFALAVKHSGEAVAGESRSLQFPICDDTRDWDGDRVTDRPPQKKKVALVAPRAQAVIQGLQPYHRPDRDGPDLLSALRDLSNIDKHKHILLTYPNASEISFRLIRFGLPFGGKIVSGFKGTIELGTLVAMIYCFDHNGLSVALPSDVEVDPDLTLEIQLGTGKFVGPAIAVLRSTHDWIRDEVFKELEPFIL
jgi:hypothetical protein